MSQKVESCIICENYRFWLELQLVDDKGQPLANVPYMLAERGTGRMLQGSSDPQGVIKAEGLTARPYTLSLEPNTPKKMQELAKDIVGHHHFFETLKERVGSSDAFLGFMLAFVSQDERPKGSEFHYKGKSYKFGRHHYKIEFF